MLIVAFGLFSIDLHHKILENYLRPNQRNQFEPKKQKNSIRSSKEINLLIKSYNRMVEELEISAIKLAKREGRSLNGKTGGT
jgi:hypothetical protein